MKKLHTDIINRLNNVSKATKGWVRADCPYCGKPANQYKFYFNPEHGGFKCNSGKCGVSGGARKLAKHLGVDVPTRSKKAQNEQNWVYTDENGLPVLKVTRIVKGGKKSYFQSHYTGKTWRKGAGDIKQALYRLPEVMKAKIIFLVEGEKCADKLAEEIKRDGLNDRAAATTTLRRAANREWGLNRYFENKVVYILPDNDSSDNSYAGQKWALWVREQLPEVIQSRSKIINLNLKRAKEDVFEWLTLKEYQGERAAKARYLLNICRDQQEAIPLVEPFLKLSEEPLTYTEEEEGDLALVMKRLNAMYDFRFNEVLLMPEYRKKNHVEWQKLDNRGLSSIYVRYNRQFNKAKLSDTVLMHILSSDEIPTYQPFTGYFDSLTRWQPGDPDYIKELAKTVETEEPFEDWHKYLRKWLIGTVATSMWKGVNAICLVLVGRQGDGKTTWLQKISPDALQSYHSSTKIHFASKDRFYYLTSRFILQLDEFDQYTKIESGSIKDFITSDSATFRPMFGKMIQKYPRSASFCATTNQRDIMIDNTGARRYLIFTIKQIDYMHHLPMDRVWAQAQYLYEKGEPYWLNQKEIAAVNDRNDDYRMASPEEELLMANYKPAERFDDEAEYLTTTDILVRFKEKTNLNLSVKTLGRALNKFNFEKVTVNGGSKMWRVKEVYRDNGLPQHPENNPETGSKQPQKQNNGETYDPQAELITDPNERLGRLMSGVKY